MAMIISFVIVDKRVPKEKLVFYLSKIATMKNIVKINHNSRIFHNFNSYGNLEGITTRYHRLLNLTTENGCKEWYRKCGILDTIGNILCIDNNFDCPINKLIVDLHSNKNNYKDEGLKEIYNENLIYNYKFYYSNESLDGNSIVSLLFSDENPRYITKSNFIVDKAAYKEYYNDNLNNNNENKEENGKQFGENLINIFVSDDYVEALVKASFTLLSFIADADNEKEKFNKYVEEKLESKENKIDKYYINVGENAYIKNYIGFKSLNDINTFNNFDYNIYQDNYPNKTAYFFGIANGILNTFFLCTIVFSCIVWVFGCAKYDFIVKNYFAASEGRNKHVYQNKDNKKSEDIKINKLKNENDNMISQPKKKEKESDVEIIFFLIHLFISLAFIGINLGFLIYSAYIHHKNYNNNKKIKKLSLIESDDFIKEFLNEFIEECKISSLFIPTYCILSLAILFHIFGFIFMFGIHCQWFFIWYLLLKSS